MEQINLMAEVRGLIILGLLLWGLKRWIWPDLKESWSAIYKYYRYYRGEL